MFMQVDGVLHLPARKKEGWRTLRGKMMKNLDLWMQLDAEIDVLKLIGKRVVLKHVAAEDEMIAGNQAAQRVELRQLLRKNARDNTSAEVFNEAAVQSRLPIHYVVSDGAAFARSVRTYTCPVHNADLPQGVYNKKSSSA